MRTDCCYGGKKREKKMWLKLFLQSSFSLFQAAWRSMRLQPLSVFLVKNGQGGDRILFRYPYKVSTPKKATTFYGNASGTSAQRFQMTKTRQNKFTYSDFTNFSNQVSANLLDFRFRSLQVLHIQKVSKLRF